MTNLPLLGTQTLNNTELAVRILTNVLELNLDNAQVLRTVGYKLMELGMIDGAAGVFEKVKRCVFTHNAGFQS